MKWTSTFGNRNCLVCGRPYIARQHNSKYCSFKCYRDSYKKAYKRGKQTLFCYCPICKYELCGTGSFVSDNRNGVTYKCQQCGCKSLWNFDVIPGALLMKHQKLEKKMTPKEQQD